MQRNTLTACACAPPTCAQSYAAALHGLQQIQDAVAGFQGVWVL